MKHYFSTKKPISNEFFGLIVGTYVACSLLLIRMIYSGGDTFFFLFWNLFLAWIPFILSQIVSQKSHVLLKRPLFLIALGMTWLVFFPNAIYIMTDLKHLHRGTSVPLWFDLLMLASFAFNGLYLGLYSLSHIHDIIHKLYGQKWAWFLIGIITYLTSFGIYLGRILRWNTWDIVTRPNRLFADILSRFLDPFSHPRMHFYVTLLAIVLFIVYGIFYIGFTQKKSSRH